MDREPDVDEEPLASAGEYFDDIATFYDAYYDDDEALADVAFYRDLATEADGPVLEVGCGTGRIYLELLRAGVDADGIDVSPGMLEVLREKAAAEGLEPTVWEADIVEFDPDRGYDLVIVPFRAFLHLIDLEAQLAALERIHGALAPGGRLALNAFAPSFEVICEEYGESEKREVVVDGDRYVHRTVTELADELEQVATLRSTIRDGDGAVVRETETPIKLLSKREFDLLFRCSPFADWTVYGGFDRDPLESTDQEMVWIARRESAEPR